MPATPRILEASAVLVLCLPAHAGGQSESARARGDSLMAALETTRAIEAYRQGFDGSRDEPELLWRAARALSNRTAETPGRGGDEPLHQEAVALARRAVAAGPDVARTHTTLATTLGRYGHWLAHECRIRCAGRIVDMGKEAYRATRRAIQLDPYDPAPFVVLGVYHRDLSTVPLVVKVIARTFLGGYPPVSLKASATNLERAVRLDPGDVTAHLELARTYAAMDRDDDARGELRAALASSSRERLDMVEKEEARRLLVTLE
ncbi:MAG TPA: tetratricopeptide repeat protein [Gemmatimonadota bacterium]|nr:tetratricopeptide repeat protein [Gemmatimonadota bacterium]